MGIRLATDNRHFHDDPTITRILIGIALTAIILLITTYHTPQEDSTIGGSKVHNLHCEEDEIIGYDSTQPAPYPLDCIHIDTFHP